MKLLFDANLSHRLAGRLADILPGSEHVIPLGLERSDDSDIWEYAKAQGFTIVTQDSDFAERSAAEGAPPKVIWIRIGNSATADIEGLLRAHRVTVLRFLDNSNESCLILKRSSGVPLVAM